MIRGVYSAVMPRHRAALLPLADETGHFVIEQKLHALGARAVFQWPDHARAWPVVRTFVAGAFGPKGVILARRGIARVVTALIVGRDRFELDAVAEEKFIGRRAMIGERAHHFAVVVTEIRPAVVLHHGPVGQIGEYRIGRIGDAVFLLRAGAAAERHIAAADDRMAADVIVSFDDDYRPALIAGFDRRRQARRS